MQTASASRVVLVSASAQAQGPKAAKAAAPKKADAKLGLAALAASALIAGNAQALTYNELQGLTYLQVKGSGLANTCPVIDTASNDTAVKGGNYKVEKMCLEPTSFSVKADGQDFVPTKLMTRLTYSLDAISGLMKVSGDSVEFTEVDGIDYAPVTVELAGGERVPFLFTIKNLNAKGKISAFGGDFNVPSYRGSSFLDPKGRGGSTGYDNAVALPARSDDEELAKENDKKNPVLKGSAVFSIAKYDPVTNEVAGVFESVQPSDTDLGAKVPKDIKITGLWYAQLQ